jgi:hypothetical protein
VNENRSDIIGFRDGSPLRKHPESTSEEERHLLSDRLEAWAATRANIRKQRRSNPHKETDHGT